MQRKCTIKATLQAFYLIHKIYSVLQNIEIQIFRKLIFKHFHKLLKSITLLTFE